MIISVASGKGGTGKTTIATNFAVSLSDKAQLLDCDVEQPNAHLFLKPTFTHSVMVTVPIPHIDQEKCSLCGKCAEICQFKAIVVIGKSVLTFPEMCHSCGGCVEVCPEKAISEMGREVGLIERGYADGLDFAHGRLRIGEAMSPPLIKKLRTYQDTSKTTIIDAPPGTSCPVIAAMKDANFVLLVTEPTPFGLYDLKLAAGAVKVLGIPCGIIVNRSDLGNSKVKEFAKEEGIPILLEIPFDRKIAEIYSRGQLIVEVMPEWKERFLGLYESIRGIVDRN